MPRLLPVRLMRPIGATREMDATTIFHLSIFYHRFFHQFFFISTSLEASGPDKSRTVCLTITRCRTVCRLFPAQRARDGTWPIAKLVIRHKAQPGPARCLVHVADSARNLSCRSNLVKVEGPVSTRTSTHRLICPFAHVLPPCSTLDSLPPIARPQPSQQHPSLSLPHDSPVSSSTLFVVSIFFFFLPLRDFLPVTLSALTRAGPG